MNFKAMKTIKQLNYIMLFCTILILSCNKNEENPPLDTTPVCEISFSNGDTNFYYGDTIVVNAKVIAYPEYVTQLSLYLDNELVFQSSERKFTYDLITTEIGGGNHELMLSALYSQDKYATSEVKILVQSDEPVLVTRDILGVGTDSATFYGTFAYTGGEVTGWGFCYNTTGSPTSEENKYIAGTSGFKWKVTGLTKLTTYYVRAWASIDKGIIYSEELIFKTTDESGTFTDERDGHEYRWVKIGEQVWMAENLAYLPFISDNYIVPENDTNIWVNGYIGMDLNEAKESYYYLTYGAIYGWGVAQDVCPSGWHLPTYDESRELIEFLGGVQIAGYKIKEKGNIHWNDFNTEATNESGFTALGAGVRLSEYGGEIDLAIRSKAAFWIRDTSEPASLGDDSFWLNASGGKVTYYSNDENNRGYSVRCIKNE